MPRAKKAAQKPVDPAQTDIEQAIAAAPPPVPAIDLIRRYRELETWADAQDKKYAESMKPYREEMAGLKDRLLAMAIEQKVNSFPTDEGTAYISEGISAKVDPNASTYVNERGETVTGRDAVLDFALEHWDRYGAEHLQIGFAIDGVKAHIAEHGAPPPGMSITQWRRMNIRKS